MVNDIKEGKKPTLPEYAKPEPEVEEQPTPDEPGEALSEEEQAVIKYIQENT